jgi:hypothetical protein
MLILLLFYFSGTDNYMFLFLLYLQKTYLFFTLFGACQDLPALYLKGGSIIPVGLPLQHVGEANPSDDLTLLVALDESGKSVHKI